MEVTEHGILQAHLSLTLRDHQRQVSDLELSGLTRLEDLSLRVDLNVLVLDGELRTVHFNFLVSWVLNNDLIRDALANWARQFNGFNLWVVLNSDLEGVEEVFTRVLSHECAFELVDSRTEGQEVKLVVFVTLACNIECVSATDEETWLLFTFDLPRCVVSLGLLRPILDLNDKVVLLLGHDGLSNGTFTLGRCRDTEKVVQKGSAIW